MAVSSERPRYYNSTSKLHAYSLSQIPACDLCSHSSGPPSMRTQTAFDQIFRNAVTRSSPTPVDIGVSDGRIAAIAPHLACEATEIDVGGRVVLPGFVDTHIHLDKACLLGRCGHNHGSLGAAIAEVSALKRG